MHFIWEQLQLEANKLQGSWEGSTPFQIEFDQLLFDFSKNPVNQRVIDCWRELAQAADLSQQVKALFAGELVNRSEHRAAMHMDLRRENPVHSEVKVALQKMQTLSQCRDENITDVIHIGIGGSDFGPALLQDVFSTANHAKVKLHFVSAFEKATLQRLLQSLDPQKTAVVVVSKSFTTRETLLNANAIRQWQSQAHVSSPTWYAVSASVAAASALGIPESHVLPMWSWVGGRFSLWSAVSFSLVLAYGMEPFLQLLAGARAMDAHFQSAPFEKNIPWIAAMLDLYFQHCFHMNNRAVIGYQSTLRLLPEYCQQLHMESLGKSVLQNGEPVSMPTGQIIWGGVGTNSQHTFHQLLMQGTQRIPVDFILPLRAFDGAPLEEEAIAHCLAQSKTLMQGYHHAEVVADLQQQGLTQDEIETLAPHKVIKGHQPSNLILLKSLSAYNLGALLAMYEHKVFVQSAIWGINAFDQWGVERGKVMANQIIDQLQNQQAHESEEQATARLITWVTKTENVIEESGNECN